MMKRVEDEIERKEQTDSLLSRQDVDDKEDEDEEDKYIHSQYSQPSNDNQMQQVVSKLEKGG